MDKELEKQFFRSLMFVLTHFIKHAVGLHEQWVPLMESYENGEWQTLSVAEKKNRIGELHKRVTGSDEFSKHFAQYPHDWSKKKFNDFKQQLAEYYGELSRG